MAAVKARLSPAFGGHGRGYRGDVPDDAAQPPRSDPGRGWTQLDVSPPRPARGLFLSGWPVMLLIVLLALVLAILFPTLAALLIIGAPLAVAGAFAVAIFKARNIRLVVTPEVVRVISGNDGVACDRTHIEFIVLAEGLKRRPLAPRCADLMLLDRSGRTLLLLSGLLWPVAIHEQVIAALSPVPVERVPGPQSALQLLARYPWIFASPTGERRELAGRRLGLIVGLGVLGTASVLLLAGTFIR